VNERSLCIYYFADDEPDANEMIVDDSDWPSDRDVADDAKSLEEREGGGKYQKHQSPGAPGTDR
jgi:hypothetical protein